MTTAERVRSTARHILEDCMATDLSAEVAVARLAVETDMRAPELADVALDMRTSAVEQRGWL
ncbi:MAG: class I SAM-dependent methyltransferase, partial [Mesorhizobium sp.]